MAIDKAGGDPSVGRPVVDAMAVSQSAQLGMATAFFGALSFLLAILGELNKVINAGDVAAARADAFRFFSSGEYAS